MRAYAITWDGSFRNLIVATCPTIEDAKAVVDNARADGGIAAAQAEDLDKSGPALVSLYNALNDLVSDGKVADPVKRFTTRGDGQRRVFALLESNFKNAPEVAAPSTVDTSAATTETNNEEADVATKTTKTKKVKAPKAAKAPKVKKERVAKTKTARQYKATVVSKGGEKAKASALEMIERKMGATAQEIADKLELSLGSAKNLVWYLRRDGHKITVNKDVERKPYVII